MFSHDGGVIIAGFSIMIVTFLITFIPLALLISRARKKEPEALRSAQRMMKGQFKWMGRQFKDGYIEGKWKP